MLIIFFLYWLMIIFLISSLRTTALAPFVPDFTPPLIVLVCIQTKFVKGLFFTFCLAYIFSLFSILPLSVYLFSYFLSFTLCKICVELTNWKNISTLTMLGASVSLVLDLLLIGAISITPELSIDWLSLLISSPIRALFNSLSLYFTLNKFNHRLEIIA